MNFSCMSQSLIAVIASTCITFWTIKWDTVSDSGTKLKEQQTEDNKNHFHLAGFVWTSSRRVSKHFHASSSSCGRWFSFCGWFYLFDGKFGWCFESQLNFSSWLFSELKIDKNLRHWLRNLVPKVSKNLSKEAAFIPFFKKVLHSKLKKFHKKYHQIWWFTWLLTLFLSSNFFIFIAIKFTINFLVWVRN